MKVKALYKLLHILLLEQGSYLYGSHVGGVNENLLQADSTKPPHVPDVSVVNLYPSPSCVDSVAGRNVTFLVSPADKKGFHYGSRFEGVGNHVVPSLLGRVSLESVGIVVGIGCQTQDVAVPQIHNEHRDLLGFPPLHYPSSDPLQYVLNSEIEGKDHVPLLPQHTPEGVQVYLPEPTVHVYER